MLAGPNLHESYHLELARYICSEPRWATGGRRGRRIEIVVLVFEFVDVDLEL